MDALPQFRECLAESENEAEYFSASSLGETVAFDTHTRLATRLLGAPTALISLVQEHQNRQIFLSQQNLCEPWASLLETPLSHSFCQHVKASGRPLIVPDAREDAFLRCNAAISDLGVVSYLGVPIHCPERRPIGAICVIDSVRRDWTEDDVLALTDLASCVDDEIRLRTTLASNVVSHQRTRHYNAMREAITLAFMAPDLGVHERFQALLNASCEVLGMDSAVIAKIDGDRPEFLFRHGPAYCELTGRDAAFSETLASVIVSGQQQICISKMGASRHHDRLAIGGRRPGSYAGIPLICEGVVYGVLEMCSTKPRAVEWTEEEQSLMSLISIFACAHLGIFGKINALLNAEAALFHELSLTNREHIPDFVR